MGVPNCSERGYDCSFGFIHVWNILEDIDRIARRSWYVSSMSAYKNLPDLEEESSQEDKNTHTCTRSISVAILVLVISN